MRVLKKVYLKLRQDGMISLIRSVKRYLTNKTKLLYVTHCRGGIISTRGVYLDVGDENISDRLKLKMLDDTYESGESYAINKYFPTDRDVIELGAGLGFITCFTIDMINVGNKYIAVEANPNLVPILERNRKMNDSDFEICQAAYSNESTNVELTIPDDVWAASINKTKGTKTEVPTINLKTLIKKYNIDEFGIIVDIEGAEADLLTNEMDILESHCEFMIIEFHDQKNIPSDVESNIEQGRKRLRKSSFTMVERTPHGISVYKNDSI